MEWPTEKGENTMKEAIQSVGKVRLRGLALLIVTFVAGALAGAAVEHIRAPESSWSGPLARDGGRPTPPMRRASGQLIPAALENLDLSEHQRKEIRRILRESRSVTDSLLDRLMPRLRTVTDSVRQEIRSVLTPEQRERLESALPASGSPGPRFRPDGPGPPLGGKR